MAPSMVQDDGVKYSGDMDEMKPMMQAPEDGL
jgi:hypothetical protein